MLKAKIRRYIKIFQEFLTQKTGLLTVPKLVRVIPVWHTVSKIEGEYAYIVDVESGNEVFIALALLPEGTDIGTKLKYEAFSYEIEE